jgi:cobalt-precorrin 5A hydrolase
MASGTAPAAMELGQDMIIAGIGCRRQVSATDVITAIEMAMDHLTHVRLPDRIAIPASKAREAGLLTAAETLAVRLVLIPQQALESADARSLTRSAKSLEKMNVHCVSEAAALAAGGPRSRLLVPRVARGNVTCALVESELNP